MLKPYKDPDAVGDLQGISDNGKTSTSYSAREEQMKKRMLKLMEEVRWRGEIANGYKKWLEDPSAGITVVSPFGDKVHVTKANDLVPEGGNYMFKHDPYNPMAPYEPRHLAMPDHPMFINKIR